MKKYTLLFALLLLACNNEGVTDSTSKNQNSILLELQNSFSPDYFSKVIPYHFNIDWNNTALKTSVELGVDYYEFPLTYTDAFNPNTINANNKQGKYNTFYKLLAVANEDGTFSFYLTRVYQIKTSDGDTWAGFKFQFSDTSNLNGILQLLDADNELVYAKRFDGEEGKDSAPYYLKKGYLGIDSKKPNTMSRMEEDCYTVITYQYRDWYKVYPDGTLEFTNTQYLGYTTETYCTSYYYPDLNISGGGGTGIYIGSGDGGVYNDCGDPVHGCLYEILDQIQETPCPGDPVPNPEIVSSGSSGKKGGSFGCTRIGTSCEGISGKKKHNGLDIKATVNTNAYATHSGTITSIRNIFDPGRLLW